MVVCLFHSYKLFSFTQYLLFASSNGIFRRGGGGGGVILTFTVFDVHARYGLQHLDTIFHKIRVFL